jgi:hypothetical protein
MGQTDTFFSLLRDIICDFPDTKATTAKVEERVREWQESPASALNPWLRLQQNWVDCVVSALKFLSGDVLGIVIIIIIVINNNNDDNSMVDWSQCSSSFLATF